MEEGKLDILDLSKPKNTSLPISLDKMKKSKVFKNKMTKKFQQSFKKCMPKEKDKGEKKIKNKFLSIYIINNQLQKHNSNPSKKNIMIINDIIETKTNHFLAIFKDYLITDYIDEFLKRYFTVNESTELLPKFYIYYQNYLKFFCRGLFTDFQANKIIQEYGECQAELYYNKNYGGKEKKSKKNRDENNDNNIDDGENNSNVSRTSSNVNKLRLLFTDTVKNSINRIENSKLLQNYIYKYNTNEISNIFYKSKNETMTLNDDTKIYNEDNLMTNENSLINLIDVMIHKKREKKKIIKNKNIKNNYNINDKNIVNIYKNLLDQSPIRSARNLNYNNKNGLYNKTSKKVASIKIFNKNIPMIIKNKKQNNNISNDIKEKNIKTPISEKPNKIISKNNFHSRNSKFNNSGNFFMKSNLTQKIYRNTSKSISSRIGLGNIMTSKNNNKNKFSSFNTNLNQNSKKKLKFNGIYFKNTNENFLSTSSSRNLKKNFICSYQSNKNNQKLNNRIRHYQYITYKNKNQLKQKNSKHKQSCSLSNSNSIFNNFHININNNIMLLNNNNNTHYNSNKNNLKVNSKIKKRIDDIKLTLNKQNKSRNNGIDLKKYKTEIKYLQNNNIKSKKNICSLNRKYIYLAKTKSKDKSSKNREQLIRNKSNIFSSNHSCFKIKKTGEDSDVMPSLKNIKKLNNSNKNLNLNKVPKINIIFDYKRK
jgi:hypothetical protein